LQELYATSSKFDKLKISKAIVAATRHFGGRFLQADEKRGGAHFDIGDKPAWSKTSQALREGQKEIREKLAEENGGVNLEEYKQVISEQTFFAYSCKMLGSIYKQNEHGEVSACGPNCPAAKRRKELQSLGVDPAHVHRAMQAMSPNPPPPMGPSFAYSQPMQPPVQQQFGQCNTEFVPPNTSGLTGSLKAPTALQSMGSMLKKAPGAAADTLKKAPGVGAVLDSLEPLNYKLDHGLPKPNLIKKFISTGSVFSLRNVCAEEFEMTSDEGKALMEQLNMEVDELIRQKSVGLIEIDSKYAFEDLVFEEDSVDFDAIDAENDLNAPKRELSEDMSLMNMSILTINDDAAKSPTESLKSSLKKKPAFPIRQSVVANNPYLVESEKPQSRVSFAHSVMSLDNESFKNLMTYLQDSDRNVSDITPESDRSNSNKFSRKMGFPVKQSVVDAYAQGMPTVVGQKSESEPEEKLSSLTIDGDALGQGDQEFLQVAGEVASNNSAPLSGRSLKVSMTGVSDMNMSISSDIGGEDYVRHTV